MFFTIDQYPDTSTKRQYVKEAISILTSRMSDNTQGHAIFQLDMEYYGLNGVLESIDYLDSLHSRLTLKQSCSFCEAYRTAYRQIEGMTNETP